MTNIRFQSREFARCSLIRRSLKHEEGIKGRVAHCVLLLAALTLVFSLSISCRKKVTTPGVVSATPMAKESNPSAPSAVIPNEPSAPMLIDEKTPPTPERVPAPTALDLGEKDFLAGKYQSAAKFFSDYVKTNPNSPNRDKALFYQVLSNALTKGTERNLKKCQEAVKQLISDFPDSLYRSPAELVLELLIQVQNLQADIKMKEEKNSQLSEELRKLKEIDLKRRPSRLPE